MSYKTSLLEADLDESRSSIALLRLSRELNLLDIQLTRSPCLPCQVGPLYGTSKRFGWRRSFPRTKDRVILIEQAVADSLNKQIPFCGLGVGVNSS